MWSVNGIPVPDIIDELVQWDENNTGMTTYQVDHYHQMYVWCLVPRANTARGRTITRHEFLHAVHDNPRAAKTQAAIEAPFDAEVVDGVSDAFVHANYWPVGEDVQADKDAAKTALEDLREQQKRIADDHDKSLAITLRALATLKAVGDVSQQLEGSKIALGYLSAAQLTAMNKVIGVVQAGDRLKALQMFSKIVKEEG